MENPSIWEKVAARDITYPALDNDIHVDIAIIGAGITGLTAALQLIEEGRQVAVFEAHSVGSGTTGFSTGNLYIPIQPYYQKIRSKFDQEMVQVIAHARRGAIQYIEKTVTENGIDCHFSRRPSYFFIDDLREEEFLDNEVAALKEADIDINYTNDFPLPVPYSKAAMLPNQARFNPLLYAQGLAEIITSRGGVIYENSAILSTEEHDTNCELRTKHFSITANKIIMGTHTPKGINKLQMLLAPYRSYAVAVHLKGRYPNGHFWSMSKPHYITSTHAVYSDEIDTLVVAGGHHKTGHPQHHDNAHYFQDIERYIHKYFDVESIDSRWSAQHYQSADDVPYIGLASRHSKHSYVATGYFADGLVYGTVAGLIIPSMILGKDNQVIDSFNPNRFTPIASAKEFLKENIGVLGDYLSDIPGHVEAHHFSEIAKGEGKIIAVNNEKFAAYRDEKSKLYVVSAVCTHMKCIVNWNNAEKSWDCPCHGSRFTVDGAVIEGPALVNLTPKEVKPLVAHEVEI
jgi:glycine/D-amino acid oxidase-like deaminating enzyme/nitrite reductase/ring-hydroxylating ferredoxin subunit